MPFLDRISPWQRGRDRRASSIGEARATRDALAANIAGLARAMEERFVSIAERVDGLRDAQAAEADRAAELLAGRIDRAFGELRATLDARLDGVAHEVAALRDGQDFARALRELKRDLGAQISLSSFETAAEIRAAGVVPADRAASGAPARPA